MTQYSRPIADLSTGAWTTTPLWSKLNEDPYNDGTEIVLNNQTANACDIDLGTVTDPNSSVNHILRIRAHKTGSGTINCTAVLYCGATLIRSQALTLGTGYAETTITLTAGEADAITNYADLHVTLTGTCAASTRYVYVSWIVLEVPDSGTIVNETATAAITNKTVAAVSDVNIQDLATLAISNKTVAALENVNLQDPVTLTRQIGFDAANFTTIEETLYGN